jgi:hypothetical protein
MGYVVIWLLFAVATRAVAERKGRVGPDLTRWTVLGLLFGVFALFVIAIQRATPEALDGEKSATGELRRCPYCAELIRPEAIKCRYCGEAVTALPRTPASSQPYRIIEAPPGSLSVGARWMIALSVLMALVLIVTLAESR